MLHGGLTTITQITRII